MTNDHLTMVGRLTVEVLVTPRGELFLSHMLGFGEAWIIILEGWRAVGFRRVPGDGGGG